MPRLSENAVSFFGAGGHKHDGVSSTLISTDKYSLFDFNPGYKGAQSRVTIQQTNQTALEEWVMSIVNTKVLAPAGLDLAPGLLSGKSIRANTITAVELQANTITASELTSNLVLVNNVIRSNSYNGTIAANGAITANGNAGWAITSFGSAEFSNAVIRGNVTANAGSIGGWTINSNSITANSTTLFSTGAATFGNTAIAANGQITNGGYTLSNTGVLTATGANISGSITAITLNATASGTLGNFVFNSSGMTSFSANSQNYMTIVNYGDIGIYSAPLSGAHSGMAHNTQLVGEYIVVGRTDLGTDRYVTMGSPQGQAGNVGFEIIENGSSRFSVYQNGNVSLYGTLNGYSFTSGRHNGANQMVHTDVNGYLQVGYINSSNGNEGNNSNPSRVWGTNGSDDYLRSYLTSALSVGSAGRLVSTTNNDINTTGLYPSSVVEPLSIKQNDASGQNTISYRNQNNNLLMYVTDTGNVRGQGNYQNISDRNSKENIVYVDREVLGNAVDFIKPATFNYINGTERHLGFIAQDVQEFLPDAIKSFDENRLSIDTDVIIAALVAKCQQLEARIQTLEGV